MHTCKDMEIICVYNIYIYINIHIYIHTYTSLNIYLSHRYNTSHTEPEAYCKQTTRNFQFARRTYFKGLRSTNNFLKHLRRSDEQFHT